MVKEMERILSLLDLFLLYELGSLYFHSFLSSSPFPVSCSSLRSGNPKVKNMKKREKESDKEE